MNYGPASRFYDLFSVKHDIPFYRELAWKHGRKALELGVGTGRVALELARAGIVVWGIDNSKHMLAVAREKMRKEVNSVRGRVTLKFGDMRNFRIDEHFPLVYIASSTFEHCITDEDQRRCLSSAFAALKAGGILAFDISQAERDKTSNSWWIEKAAIGSDREVVRTIFSRQSPSSGVVSVNLFFDVYHEGKMVQRYFESGEAKILERREVEKALRDVGFRVDQLYGDFDMSQYNQKSRKMVFVATKL
ncbi:MAG: class I SAM-dependent methyltransferase [Candidatus Bathyarchaeota archaeon]|nr:class I SAM-dependent methyltransferase [Candidatus Bathyarchaeota archaeon]